VSSVRFLRFKSLIPIRSRRIKTTITRPKEESNGREPASGHARALLRLRLPMTRRRWRLNEYFCFAFIASRERATVTNLSGALPFRKICRMRGSCRLRFREQATRRALDREDFKFFSLLSRQIRRRSCRRSRRRRLINIEVAEHSPPRNLRTLFRVGVIAPKLIKYEIAEYKNNTEAKCLKPARFEYRDEPSAFFLSFASLFFSFSLKYESTRENIATSRGDSSARVSGLCDSRP